MTLQDMALLSGLPIDGDAVTGVDTHRTVDEWQDYCEEHLGIRPPHTAFTGSRLKMTSIATLFVKPLRAEANAITIDRYARAYILLLIGAYIFPDKSQNKVGLMYLQHLEDLDASGRLSWGSAALACLYREMCRATAPDAIDIGGPLVILQVLLHLNIIISYGQLKDY